MSKLAARQTDLQAEEAFDDVIDRGKPEVPSDGRELRRQRLDKYRSPLNIRTPSASPQLLARWHGMPPTKLKTPAKFRFGGTINL